MQKFLYFFTFYYFFTCHFLFYSFISFTFFSKYIMEGKSWGEFEKYKLKLEN